MTEAYTSATREPMSSGKNTLTLTPCRTLPLSSTLAESDPGVAGLEVSVVLLPGDALDCAAEPFASSLQDHGQHTAVEVTPSVSTGR